MADFAQTADELARGVRDIREDAGLTPAQKSRAFHDLFDQFEEVKLPTGGIGFIADADPREFGPTALAAEEKEKEFADDHLLRAFIESLGFEFRSGCREVWRVFTKVGTGERKICPICCQERGQCPCCGIAYGKQAGYSLHSLVWVALGLRRDELQEKGVLLWLPVATYPIEVSEAIQAELEPDRLEFEKTEKTTSKIFAKLQDIEKHCLAAAFGVYYREMAVHFGWQWWHSSRPLSKKLNIHAHMIVLNVTKDGRWLRRRGEIPQHRVELYKREKFRRLTKLFPGAMRAFCAKMIAQRKLHVWKHLNVFFRFALNTEQGREGIKKACEYDTRHPLYELRKYMQQNADNNGTIFNREAASTFFVSWTKYFQRMTTSRYCGFIAKGKRKAVGIVPEEEDDEETWEVDVTSGIRKLHRFAENGVLFERSSGGFVLGYEYYPLPMVRWSNTKPAKTWKCQKERPKGSSP